MVLWTFPLQVLFLLCLPPEQRQQRSSQLSWLFAYICDVKVNFIELLENDGDELTFHIDFQALWDQSPTSLYTCRPCTGLYSHIDDTDADLRHCVWETLQR